MRPSVECGEFLPTARLLYAQLYPASPIAHVRGVRAPVLHLDSEDRRVVNVQGKAFLLYMHYGCSGGKSSCWRLSERDMRLIELR